MFLNPIMLAGIAGAAIPLILHLLSRARYRTRSWGAMMFLEDADPHHRRHARLRSWLLLALRMTLVALLAVTLARPVALGQGGGLPPNAHVTAVILLDHSGSMAYGRNSQTRMDQARQAVGQILSTLHPGDQAALIALGDTPHGYVPLPRPTADLQSIADVLDTPRLLDAGYGVADMADGLRIAADIFDRQKSRNRRFFIVCDRQALNWRNVTSRVIQIWRSRMNIPGPPPRFFLLPVGGWESDNVAIDSMTADSPQIISGQPTEFDVALHNYGQTPRTNLRLTLSLGNRQIAATTIDLAPRASINTRQSVRIRTLGSQIVTASIDSQGVHGDNQFSVAVDVVPPLDVLIIRSDAPSIASPNPPDYLRLALTPFLSAGRNGPDIAAVQIIKASAADDWSNWDRRKFSVVILDNVSRITSAQAQSLEQYIYGGGGLLVAPGSLTRTTNFNDMLYRGGEGILPASLAEPISPSDASAVSIGKIDRIHPIFQFLSRRSNLLSAPLIGRYFPISALRPDAQVLARYTSASPFMIAGTFGRGRVILLTTPLDQSWSTLPLTDCYLPLVQNVVRFLAAGPTRNLRPGQPFVARFDNPDAQPSAQVVTPSGATRDVALEPVGDSYEARFTDTAEPGIYTISTRRLTQRFVVAAPREESDLTPLSPAQWQTLSANLGFKIVELTQTPLAPAIGNADAPRELWAILLTAVIALGIVEILLTRIWSVRSPLPQPAPSL